MTTAVIITLCTLLLIAYIFDLTASKTRIPSVILLLALGLVVRQITNVADIHLPNFNAVLPILGTVGLILIVLEGSLELEINKSKTRLIGKSFVGALLSMLASAFLLAWLFRYFGGFGFKDSLANAIPFCVISSAIAIPSVRALAKHTREFVIYESSLSDILGVLFFNFITMNSVFDMSCVVDFGLELVIISIVSFVASIGLSFLLSRIEHHIKFGPIILLIILIYSVSKIYHLPALVFILFFGLFIGNLDELKHWKWIAIFKPEELNKEVMKFRELTIEAAFVIRALFFLLFGYLLDVAEIINTATAGWAVAIVAIIFAARILQLLASRLPLMPLLFVAPRGLITVLLFLSIDPTQQIGLVNKSLVIQVVLLTAVVMMVGMMVNKRPVQEPVSNEPVPEGGVL